MNNLALFLFFIMLFSNNIEKIETNKNLHIQEAEIAVSNKFYANMNSKSIYNYEVELNGEILYGVAKPVIKFIGHL